MSAMLEVAYLNGRYLPLGEARVSPLDRGFLFGEGIYEVIPVFAGRPLRATAHLQRLARSCAQIELPNPLADAAGAVLIDEMIQRNGGGDMAVYVQITRGADSAPRNHVFPEHCTPTVFAMCQTLDPRAPEIARDGVSAIVREDNRWTRCDIKATSLLANTILRTEAKRHGAVETILVRDGIVTEGAASSVIAVVGDSVITPRRSPHILPGTTQELVFELLRAAGREALEQDFDDATLRAADEVWLASSTREILPVTRLDEQAIGDGRPGPLWRQLDADYQACKMAAH